MSRAGDAVRGWMAAAPAERLAILRVLVGGFAALYVVARLPHLLSYAGMDPAGFRPVGVVAVLDRPLLPSVVTGLVIATAVFAIPFVVGWRFRVTGPVFALLLLWTLSYRNSWGMVFHTENLMVLHVIALAVSRSADACSLDARRRGRIPEPGPQYAWPIKLMAVVVVASYVLAGVAKLRFGGVGWADGEVLRNYVAMDNARKLLLGDSYSQLATPLLAHPSVFAALAWMTLVVELFAPVALLGRRLAAGWTVAAVGFHWGVLVVMMIVFPYPMIGVGFACLFRLETLATWPGRLRRRLR